MAVLNSPRVRQVLATVVAYVVSLAVIAPVTLYVVLLMAGPHTGFLPHAMERPLLAMGWLIVLVCPLLLARKVWRRMAPA